LAHDLAENLERCDRNEAKEVECQARESHRRTCLRALGQPGQKGSWCSPVLHSRTPRLDGIIKARVDALTFYPIDCSHDDLWTIADRDLL
jgi:hypothetical protein